jgi:transcriptional regulator with XRE-family HTH domain
MEGPNIYESFGLRLSALRRERGLSQQALAHALSVTRQAVSNWERGQTTPDLGTMEALCRLLNVDWNRLCGGEPLPVRRRLPVPALAAGAALLVLAAALFPRTPPAGGESSASWDGYRGQVLRSHLTTVTESGPDGPRKQAARALAELLASLDGEGPVPLTPELRQAFDLAAEACAFLFLPACEEGVFEDRDDVLTWLYRGLSRGGPMTEEQTDRWLSAWFGASVRWTHGSTEHYTLEDGRYWPESAWGGSCTYTLEALERRKDGSFWARLGLSETDGTGISLPERTLTLSLTAEEGQICFSSVAWEEPAE